MKAQTTVLSIAAGTLLALLGGCSLGPVQTWYSEGADRPTLADDLLDCRVYGAQQVPVDTRIRTTPQSVMPSRTTCEQDGNRTECVTTGGMVSGGQEISYDANEDLRIAVFDRCMQRRGYQQVDLPRCETGQDLPSITLSNRLPPLTSESCVVKTPESGWQVVTPASF